MQGTWGWGNFKPHSSETLDDGPWQGQWENDRCGEVSGWETSTWDQLSKGASSHYEEFENVLRWDDSGAQEAFEHAQKIQERNVKGSISTLSLPSPDLYIQLIDWDSREDLKLPDSAENFSQFGEGTVHRKRGRKGGAFRRQFDRQDSTRAADWKQNGKAFLDPVSAIEANPKADHTLNHGSSSNMPAPDVPLDAHQRESVPCELRSPVQDHVRSNWSGQWSSQPRHRQNFASSNWQDPGRSNWNEGYNHQSRHGWQQANVSFEPVRGWGRGGFPHHGSHGLPNDARYQSIPAARMSNPGNEWMCPGEANGRGFRQQPMEHFNRGSKEQNHVPTPPPDNSHRWRQQQRPYHPWQ